MLAAGAGCCGTGAPVLAGSWRWRGWGWAGDQDGDGSLAGEQLRVLVSVAADPSVWARCQISADIHYCIQRSRFDSRAPELCSLGEKKE